MIVGSENKEKMRRKKKNRDSKLEIGITEKGRRLTISHAQGCQGWC